MEIPLRDCCCRCGALDAGQNTESPEVDEDEEDPEPPGGQVDEKRQLGARAEMPAQEDAGEHDGPKPGPGDDGSEGRKSNEEKASVRCQYAAGELEDGYGFGEGMAAFVNAKGPENGEDGGYEGKPAHRLILDTGTVVSTLETGDEWIEEEGEQDDGNSDQDGVNERTDIRSEDGQPK